MRRLILLRHGKAERAAASGRDFDRALTERGRGDVALTGRRLAEDGVRVDLALVSSAMRTRQTWDAVASAFPGAEMRSVRALYHAEPDAVLAAARAESADAVMIVGHNPGLHALSARLAAQDPDGGAVQTRLAAGLPTGAAAVFAFDAAGRATAEGVYVPKDYGGGADE